MKKFKIGSLIALLLGLVLFTGLIVNADEFTNVGSLYDKAVNENIIDPNLYPKANWYLLAGDATAIPVLSCILESLPATANGKCIIEVHSKEDEQLLKTKANIDFYWLHNPKPEQSSTLAKEVKKVSFPDFPNVSRYSYVAAEFNTVKEIRNYLRKEMNWKREELNAYSYWKAGVSEDNSAQERHNENEEAYQKRHTVINTTHKI